MTVVGEAIGIPVHVHMAGGHGRPVDIDRRPPAVIAAVPAAVTIVVIESVACRS